jgi:hypothetical protein
MLQISMRSGCWTGCTYKRFSELVGGLRRGGIRMALGVAEAEMANVTGFAAIRTYKEKVVE